MSNKFVIADPGVCIGCKTCMAACLVKHDVTDNVALSRLNLVTTLSVSAPIVCHHCSDAPCAAACPTGALYPDPHHERIGVLEQRCIGCQSCVLACPYGAVSVAKHSPSTKFGNMQVNQEQRSVVIKCDLCVDAPEGPACVRACLTKALMLVDDEALERGIKNKNREAALAAESYSSLPLNPVVA